MVFRYRERSKQWRESLQVYFREKGEEKDLREEKKENIKIRYEGS